MACREVLLSARRRMVCAWVREGDTQREAGRETERNRDRETEKLVETETERLTEASERGTEREGGREGRSLTVVKRQNQRNRFQEMSQVGHRLNECFKNRLPAGYVWK